MKLRLATLHDLQKIAQLNNTVQFIHHQVWPEYFCWPTEQDKVEKAIGEIIASQEYRVFLAEDSLGPLGYIVCEIVRRAEDTFHKPREFIYIHQISVNIESRRMGIGSRLIQSALDLAEQESIDLVMLDVWSFNASAKEFFSKKGFTVYNEHMMVDRSKLSGIDP